MINFAYDGSINGDWVARYAIRLALHAPEKRLRLIHVDDGSCPADHRATKLERLEAECDMAGVKFEVAIIPIKQSVAATLASVVGDEEDAFLVCGTRVRSRAKGFLAGTVSQALLQMRLCHVVAMRVVQPGLLGVPHRILLPVAGHPKGFRSGIPLVRLVRPDIRSLHVLRVMEVARRSLLHQHRRRFQRLRKRGRDYVDRIEQELVTVAEITPELIDTFVRIADDWHRQIIIHASHHKSQLICMGASGRGLAHRMWFGNRLEYVLANAPCDVAVYGGVH